jgi:hypothetical protein
MLEVHYSHIPCLISALFLVGFFEWGIVYFTDWEKQVKLAYARQSPSMNAANFRMAEDSRAEEAAALPVI